MKRVGRILLGLALTLIVLAIALWLWIGSLDHENSLSRPTGGRYEIEGGAVYGGPKPRADGYAVSSSGQAGYLPIMPPDRPMNIHHAETERANSAAKTCFWPTGGRTRSGYLTTDTNNPTVDNQLPDTGTTYQITFFTIPYGGKLVVKGQYPHLRHWNFVTYGLDGTPRDVLSDRDIEPDTGSQNPFRVGVRRDTPQRSYTFSIVSGKAVSPRPANTLYTLDDAGKATGMLMRNYVPDGSRDFYGAVPLPDVELHTGDGKVLKGDDACAATAAPLRGKQVPTAVPTKVWLAITHLFSKDPTTAPAHPFETEPLEMFFNKKHLLARLFAPSLPTAKLAVQEGGFWSNADTRYGYKYINQQHGKVYALRGKAPATPATWDGAGEPLKQADLTYWSVCTTMGMSTGMAVDCVYDEIISKALDDRRFFTIVISREVDRPANATEQCGVTWMEWGNGDGIVGGTPDHGLVINRHTEPAPAFKQSWFANTTEGSERKVMGDYLPYMVNFHERQAFETLGCPIDTRKIDARIDTFKARE